jgi:hypothetical protein
LVAVLVVKINLVQQVVQAVVADQAEQALHLLVELELLVKEIMVVITGPQHLAHLQLAVVVELELLEEVLQTTIIRVLAELDLLHQ